MKYENARDVLPPELLAEVQKYAAGKLLYVPGSGARRPWGEATGCRRQIEQRNREIRRKFEAGVSVDELAETYFLASETIKNLVYGRKEPDQMEFSDIFALYDEQAPLHYEVVYEDDRTAEWGEVYYLKDLDVTFPARRMLIHVYQYAFATAERIAEQARLIEAYNSLGYRCAEILPNRFGELTRDVTFDGHPCLVYAEEMPELAVEEKNAVRRDEFGEQCWHRDALVCLARIAALHLEGREIGCCTMFDGPRADDDNSTRTAAVREYEDWIEEYLEYDLKKRIEEAYPALAPKYAEVRRGMREVRNELRRMWFELPTSLFHPGVSHSGIILDENERLIGLREFVDGGRDVCLNAFLNTLGSFTEDENFALDVLREPELRRKRDEGVIRGLRLIGQYYRFTEREIEAAPLVWLNLQFGGIWYWNNTLFEDGKDEADVSAMLDDMLRLIAIRGCEIDFASAMTATDC